MKNITSYIVLIVLGSFLFTSCGSIALVESDSKPISHELWDSLLKKNVAANGLVNYKGFVQDSLALNKYIRLLSDNHPNIKHWNEEERLAYWINAYNAFTVKLIIDNYPVKSIKDIKKGIPFVNTVWDIKFINIEGHEYDLNAIEHSIIRKRFDEPRIHFAINCASISCPPLHNEAFVAERIKTQLDGLAKSFINDPIRNEVGTEKAELSKIFKWFKGDFTKKTDLRTFINKYANTPLKEGGDISYKDYNWNLNEVSNN